MPSRAFRLLAISDIHMDNKLPQAQLVSNGMSDRLYDQLKLWERVHKTCIEYKPDRLVVLGDLFNKSLVDAVTLTATVEAITSSPIPVDILPGNHDAISTSGGRFVVEAFGKMGHKRVRYIGFSSGGVPIVYDGWLRLWPIEYCTKDKALERIHDIRNEIIANGRRDVEGLLMHHSVYGCKHLGWICDDGLDADELVNGFDHVLSGHFHETQKFGIDDKGMFLGAPMHHRMDDEGREAGYWLFDFTPDGRREEYFIDGGAPKMNSAIWKGSAAKTKHLARPGDYLRLVVEATHSDWIKNQTAVMEYISRLKAEGILASAKHRPVYHHSERIETSSLFGGERSADAMVSAYVNSADVEAGELDYALLERIGQEALGEARRRT